MSEPRPRPAPTLVAGLTVPYRVRFDESTPDGLARTSALLRYAQDAAWLHSERLGFDRDWYARRGLLWLVRGIELQVAGRVEMGATLAVSTAVVGFRRIWARRRTEIRIADGPVVAWAHTDWVIVNARGMPTRVPDDFGAVFEVPPGPFEPVHVELPIEPRAARAAAFGVRPQDLDPADRVNNAAYVDYLEEGVLDHGPVGRAAIAAVPRRYLVEYLAPAEPGARLEAETWLEDASGSGRAPGTRWAWRLRETGGRELARGRLGA